MQKIGTLGGVGVIKTVKTVGTIDSAAQRIEERKKNWARIVGDARMEEAVALLEQVRMAQFHSGTLPELLAEVWLRRTGVDYQAQVILGQARPDFVIYNPPSGGGAICWRIQGDYWHGNGTAQAHDAAQKGALLGLVSRGMPVVAVIDIWESAVYAGDGVLEQALQGMEIK